MAHVSKLRRTDVAGPELPTVASAAPGSPLSAARSVSAASARAPADVVRDRSATGGRLVEAGVGPVGEPVERLLPSGSRRSGKGSVEKQVGLWRVPRRRYRDDIVRRVDIVEIAH